MQKTLSTKTSLRRCMHQQQVLSKAISACTIILAAGLFLQVQEARGEDADKSIHIEVTGELASDKDSKDVIAALHRLLSGIEQRNFDKVSECLSPDVIMIEKNDELIYGRQSVLDRAKSNILGSKQKSPVKKITVKDPFVCVKGDTASVFFNADKELEDGSKFDSLCNEVYERKDGQWLVLKFQTNWKLVK